MVRFENRADAGRRLAQRLLHLRGQDVVVLGLPRGGVPVAAEVARALGAPLDVIVVRKLGVPFQPEVAMGAIGEGGIRVLDTHTIHKAGVAERELHEVELRESVELDARVERLRARRAPQSLLGRTVIVIDDGMATGSTARVACLVARRLGASRVVLAIPVAAPDTADSFIEADEVICLSTPTDFGAVGHYYVDFSPTTDSEVVALLDGAARDRRVEDADADADVVVDEDVRITVGPHVLEGHLHLPAAAPGVVLFAHGSGSSRHSPRNIAVAEVLQKAGLGTLLFDLLTRDEESDRARVFDIEGLAVRLAEVTTWLTERLGATSRRIAYFGASTGAAAALWAAAEPSSRVAAVVSRGGRTDLAGPRLGDVRAPTLLIVGGMDHEVLELNRWAQRQLNCPSSLVVVPGATHLFEEPGTLEEAARLACDWLVSHLRLEVPQR